MRAIIGASCGLAFLQGFSFQLVFEFVPGASNLQVKDGRLAQWSPALDPPGRVSLTRPRSHGLRAVQVPISDSDSDCSQVESELGTQISILSDSESGWNCLRLRPSFNPLLWHCWNSESLARSTTLTHSRRGRADGRWLLSDSG